MTSVFERYQRICDEWKEGQYFPKQNYICFGGNSIRPETVELINKFIDYIDIKVSFEEAFDLMKLELEDNYESIRKLITDSNQYNLCKEFGNPVQYNSLKTCFKHIHILKDICLYFGENKRVGKYLQEYLDLIKEERNKVWLKRNLKVKAKREK